MKYELRDYQIAASENAVRFFQSSVRRNGLLILPTGAGKSLVIADIASKLNGNVLVFQPSKEILEQNFAKLKSYGIEDCSIYSASFNSKEISRITFATIGSVNNHVEDFSHFRYVIVDEAHVTNAKGGMYRDFFDSGERKILGLTATPYRLDTACVPLNMDGKYDPTFEATNKCILKFLTRTRPRIFHDVIYQVDIGKLLERGYLAKMRYFDISVVDQDCLERNSTGRDFKDQSLFDEFQRVDLGAHLLNVVQRLLKPKNGIPRKGILVFTRFIEESERLCQQLGDSAMLTGETPKAERESLIRAFKNGEIRVLTNVGVLTTGFDYPELDTVVMARPTMSLALWYQCVGRAIRPSPTKDEAWVVDLCGNYKRFGRVEDLHLCENRPGEYIINGYANGTWRQLTNTYF